MLRELERQEANGKAVAAGWDTGLYPIYFALGQKDQALAWLEKAYQIRFPPLLAMLAGIQSPAWRSSIRRSRPPGGYSAMSSEILRCATRVRLLNK